VTVSPIALRILHLPSSLDLQARLQHVAADFNLIPRLMKRDPELANALAEHRDSIASEHNSADIRACADKVIGILSSRYGKTNTLTFAEIEQLVPSPDEEEPFKAKEGRMLVRLHTTRERKQSLRAKAKLAFRKKHGRLFCECCGFNFEERYGQRGEDFIEVHHRTPLEALLPDTETSIGELALVYSNCHSMIHRSKMWMTVEAVRTDLQERKTHFFGEE
jgi:predicted HNH restriction endonuclease